MRHWTVLAVSASIIIGGCGGAGTAGNGSTAASGAPIHRKPGSWSSKIEITRLEGKDVRPGAREQMQQLFSMMSGIAICMTPEMVAQEDVSKNLEQSAGSSDCKFDKRDVSGGTVEFSAMCDRNGRKVRMSAHGTNSETAQDITLTVQPVNAAGEPEGVMEMHVTSSYNGACKPGDFTPPAPGKATPRP